jgi:hypothetical protein
VQQNALWSSGLDTQIIKSSSLAGYITCSKPSYSNDDVCSSEHLAAFKLVVPLLFRQSLKHARPLSLPHDECIIWKAMLNAIHEGQSKSSRNSLVHHEFVPPGQSVTRRFYVQVLQRKLRDKWHAGTVVSASLYRTEPHIACCAAVPVITQPPHSPDLAPSDFWLFLTLKMGLKGTRFATVQGIKWNATAELLKIAKEAFRRCFQQWQGTFWLLIVSQTNSRVCIDNGFGYDAVHCVTMLWLPSAKKGQGLCSHYGYQFGKVSSHSFGSIFCGKSYDSSVKKTGHCSAPTAFIRSTLLRVCCCRVVPQSTLTVALLLKAATGLDLILRQVIPINTSTLSASRTHSGKWQGDWIVGNEMERRGSNLIEVVSRQLHGETEENSTKLHTWQPVSWLRFGTNTSRIRILVLSAYYYATKFDVFPECSKLVRSNIFDAICHRQRSYECAESVFSKGGMFRTQFPVRYEPNPEIFLETTNLVINST